MSVKIIGYILKQVKQHHIYKLNFLLLVSLTGDSCGTEGVNIYYLKHVNNYYQTFYYYRANEKK